MMSTEKNIFVQAFPSERRQKTEIASNVRKNTAKGDI